jgi:hypothetical protein
MAFLWSTGIATRLAVPIVAWSVLPVCPTEGLTWERLRLEDTGPLDRGLSLSLAPHVVREMIARGVHPLCAWLLPSRAIQSLCADGTWQPEGLELPPGHEGIPVRVAVDSAAGLHPVLTLRLGAAEFNDILRAGVDWTDSEDYWFGDYDVQYRPKFERAAVTSDTPPMRHVTRRTLTFNARGELKVKAEDDPLRVSARGNVTEFEGHVEFNAVPHEDGRSFTHVGRVKRLRVGFHNCPPFLDKALSKKLKRSLERSLNKGRHKRKLAKVRVPYWAPLDVIVDARVDRDAE